MTKCHPDGKACVPTNLTLAHQSTDGQKAKDILLPSDNTASSFWITNPDNIYRDNVAAGSEAIGFWIALPQHPTGAFLDQPGSANIWPRRTRLREFSGNVSHSNFDGLMFDRGPSPNGTFSVGGAGHIAYADPTDTKSEVLQSVVDKYTAYKNRNGAIWGRGEYHLFSNLKLADNAIGFTHAAGGAGLAPYTTRVVDSLFVGESDNIGNPRTPAEIAYGRSLPKPDDPDFPIRGYEFYDYRHDVVNTTFVNYQPNAQRDAGAMSYLLFTSFGMSTENSVEGLKFVNSKPVDFPAVERRWASDFGNRSAYRSATIHDMDGSVGGIPNSYIVIDNGIASDEGSCEMKAAWSAAVCKGDMGRFSIAGDFDAFGARRQYRADHPQPKRQALRIQRGSHGPQRRRAEGGDIQEEPGDFRAGNGQGLLRDPRTPRLRQQRRRRPSGQPGGPARREDHVLLQGQKTLWVKLVVEDRPPKALSW